MTNILASFLWCRIKYGRKKFYNAGPGYRYLTFHCYLSFGLHRRSLGRHHVGQRSKVVKKGYANHLASPGANVIKKIYGRKLRIFVKSSWLGNCDIRSYTNYSMLNEMRWNEEWPNTKYFRQVNYSFNTGNICSKIGQIVAEFYLIFQHLNE